MAVENPAAEVLDQYVRLDAENSDTTFPDTGKDTLIRRWIKSIKKRFSQWGISVSTDVP